MPRGPKGEKRPPDVIGAAVMVAKIATGEIDGQRIPIANLILLYLRNQRLEQTIFAALTRAREAASRRGKQLGGLARMRGAFGNGDGVYALRSFQKNRKRNREKELASFLAI